MQLWSLASERWGPLRLLLCYGYAFLVFQNWGAPAPESYSGYITWQTVNSMTPILFVLSLSLLLQVIAYNWPLSTKQLLLVCSSIFDADLQAVLT